MPRCPECDAPLSRGQSSSWFYTAALALLAVMVVSLLIGLFRARQRTADIVADLRREGERTDGVHQAEQLAATRMPPESGLPRPALTIMT